MYTIIINLALCLRIEYYSYELFQDVLQGFFPVPLVLPVLISETVTHGRLKDYRDYLDHQRDYVYATGTADNTETSSSIPSRMSSRASCRCLLSFPYQSVKQLHMDASRIIWTTGITPGVSLRLQTGLPRACKVRVLSPALSLAIHRNRALHANLYSGK